MSRLSPSLDELIQALKALPGVGQKTAQRMAFQLLERKRAEATRLADALHNAVTKVGHCQQCRTFTETELCSICDDQKRQAQRIVCVVETPADVLAIEQTSQYQGLYFVLMGHLSPLDGVGPDDIGLDVLAKQFASATVDEVILATNPTVEGDATAHYIADLAARYDIKASRIAHGVPVGGELEFVDQATLGHAFSGRKQFN